MDKDLSSLMERLGVTFTQESLLRQALVHRSYLNEHRSFPLEHNERLEFLGDAVLELIVTDFLYRTYPNPEGELTNWRSALVNATMLSKHANDLDFEKFLYLSRGETRGSAKAREVILANAYESVIGAIYLDAGYEATRGFIERDLLPELPSLLAKRAEIDPKSTFQEHVQEHMNVTPSYAVLEESGPDHARSFVVGAYVGETLVATGKGTSKQQAQVDAAKAALKDNSWQTELKPLA